VIFASAINVAKKLDKFKRESSPAARCAMEDSNSARYFKMDGLKMGRFVQPKADKGSQKWIQILINEKPNILNKQLRTKLDMFDNEEIKWLSPKNNDKYAEYRDEAFLDLLEVTLKVYPLKDFWPKRGPQWDALGKSARGKLFLVEAKSHIPELISTFKGNNKASINKILGSLEETQKRFGVKTDFDWSKTFYQYTNRLAHVYLLRKNKFDAWLVNVYFVNDFEMDGPKTADEWKGAIRLLHRCLGLREQLLQKWVVDVFIDVMTM
jgi:hypothetical protein